MKAPRPSVAWWTLAAAAVVGVPVVLLAQDAGAGAANSVVGNITGLSVQQQLYLTWAITGAKALSEFGSSVRAGGGLKRILCSFWNGEQADPNVIKAAIERQIAESRTPFLDTQKPNA